MERNMAHSTSHPTRFLITRRAFVAAGGVALVSGPVLAQMKTLSIATGGTGGVFYPLGGGLANILSKLPGIQATAEVTGGSVDNLKLIGSGQSEIAFAQCDAAYDAINGLDKFKSGKIILRTLMVLYPNQMHAVTVEGTGISKIADLKGKRVSTGSPGSATEVMAFRLMEAYGLDKDRDVKRERLGAAESVNAIKDRKIDAFFFVGGLPTSAVTDLGATPGTKLKLIDHDDAVTKMNAKYGNLYAPSVIKAGTYPGQDKDNLNSAVWNILVTGGKMTDDMAYTIVKTIFDKQPELIAVHHEAENFTLKAQVKSNSTAPWHPGALKYFAEQGVTI
jgi:TRAP transporter TAXI family solute receptor